MGIDFDENVSRLRAKLTAKAARSFAVVGGSAETWKYSRWMASDQRAVYDENVQLCLSQFSSCGIHAVSGAEQLDGVEIADTVGHVDFSSQCLVFAACDSWWALCLNVPVQSESSS